jgi:hypothetical protein
MDPQTFPTVESFAQSLVQNRVEVTPRLLVDRAFELVERRRPGKALFFIVGEVGQYVAYNQERLDEVTSAIGDDRRVLIAKVRDRFGYEVDLSPADVREVASRRVLSKNGEGRVGRGRGAPLFPLPFPAGALGGRTVHEGGQEQPGTPRGGPGRAQRGRLRSGPAQQYGARLPVAGSVASRRRLLAARLLEGGRVRRDAILMRDGLLR